MNDRAEVPGPSVLSKSSSMSLSFWNVRGRVLLSVVSNGHCINFSNNAINSTRIGGGGTGNDCVWETNA